MTNLAQLTSIVQLLRAEGDIDFEELCGDPGEFSDEDIARLWLTADEWARSAAVMAGVVGEEWVRRWRERGEAIEVDGFRVGTKKGSKYKECNDPEGFWERALETPDQIARWFNPNQIKIGSLPQSVRDTFFDEGYRTRPDAVRKPSAVPLDVLEQNRTKKELADG